MCTLARGDDVRLISKPDGCTSQYIPVTVGNTYKVVDFQGSNVVTTTDVADETGSYWRGRVEKVR